MSNIEHSFRYHYTSSLQAHDDKLNMQLACAEESNQTPVYFEGEINQPLIAARCLRGVSTLVGTRFFTPPNMLARILREADPVVTSVIWQHYSLPSVWHPRNRARKV